MQQKISIKLLPHEAEDTTCIIQHYCQSFRKKNQQKLPAIIFLKNQSMPGAKRFG